MLQRISKEQVKSREWSGRQVELGQGLQSVHFADTSELPGLSEGIIGQDRAVSALEFGLSIQADGYNLFVVGPVGTGKTTYTVQKVKEMAATRSVPKDLCYVYNFSNPDQPLALFFEPGRGHQFRAAMEQLVRDIELELMRQFESEEYHQGSTGLLKTFNDRAERAWELLEDNARSRGIALQRTSTGLATVPIGPDGRPVPQDALDGLSDAEKSQLRLQQQKVEELFEETVRQIKAVQKEARKAQQRLDEQTASFATMHLFEEMSAQFSDPKVGEFLQLMKDDVIRNHAYFHRDQEQETAAAIRPVEQDPRRRYQVNIMVDQQGQTGAPVVIESNPTYFNLFGKVEYRGSGGVLTSDYTLIKPGALHRANGGYLILQDQDLFSHPASWQGLKRALKNAEIRIDNPNEETLWVSASGLRPESVGLSVKVIMIGTPAVYHLLYQNDEALRKYFKVKVEFDAQMDRTEQSCRRYANFVASYTRQHGLLPFSKAAVAQLIEESSRQVGHQEKLSTRFSPVIELITESCFYAREQKTAVVTDEHVRRALFENQQRSNLIKDKVLELILDGTIKVQTRGEQVGQINGLAVLNSGDFVFGEPHRITARTYLGQRGVVNVDRETAMSGRIHDKGLLILSGYLSAEFAQTRPLSVSASLVFEQTYSAIDGDSASSTELYALLSSLSGLPIKQGIAVTGSVDQFGEIQPIGGVNEKIEGFFYICQAQGLTGEQGVIIPVQNVPNLFLSDEVIAAVTAGNFHIWPVRNVKEGIELLTGVAAGGDKPYPDGTVYHLIEQRLEEMNQHASDSHASP